ncbi:MAG: hypothetical protein ACM3MI_04140 [Clostridiales bacterium]
MTSNKLRNGIIALFALSVLAFSANAYSQSGGSSKAKSKSTVTSAQDKSKAGTFQRGPRYADANNDGICDYARDSDGDGIPNCQDSSFVRPRDGRGRMSGMGRGMGRGMGSRGCGYGMRSGMCDGSGPRWN